jgi:hypothetical protein
VVDVSVRRGIRRWNQGAGHSYSIDGKRAVGVTTALRALPKELTGWAARTVAEYVCEHPSEVMGMLEQGGSGPTVSFLSGLPFQRRNDAGIRGTAVHKLAEPAARGEEVEVPPELEGYVESYIRFLDDVDPKPIHEELVVASREHLVAGTLDSIMDIPDLGRCLVDYKTGTGIYGETALQVAAYRHMEVCLDPAGNEQPMPAVDATYCLHIRPDGYDLIPLQAGPDEFDAFLAVLKVYRTCIQKVQNVKKLDRLLGEPLTLGTS